MQDRGMGSETQRVLGVLKCPCENSGEVPKAARSLHVHGALSHGGVLAEGALPLVVHARHTEAVTRARQQLLHPALRGTLLVRHLTDHKQRGSSMTGRLILIP
jgi:hypothetical protein